MNPSTTPTPRTDAKWIEAQNTYDFVERDFARQLERELSEKTTEVARLREENQKLRERIAELEIGWDEEAYQRRHQNLE